MYLLGYDVMLSVVLELIVIIVLIIILEDEVLIVYFILCEFWQYSYCFQIFYFVLVFIDYCFDYYQCLLLKILVCWYCDDWLFSVLMDLFELWFLCYFSRLWYIGGYYCSEVFGLVCFDYFVLRYLYVNWMISIQRFNEFNINESWNLERFMSGFMYFLLFQGWYDE